MTLTTALTKTLTTAQVKTISGSYLAIALQEFLKKISSKVMKTETSPRKPALVVLKRGKLSGRATDFERRLKLLTRRSRVQKDQKILKFPSRAQFSSYFYLFFFVEVRNFVEGEKI